MDVESISLGNMGVLGIALVMEEVGKGARLVFRYPASPPSYFVSNKKYSKQNKANTKSNATNLVPRESHTNCKNQQSGDSNGSIDSTSSIDLFFDLPARVISKLFRPKRPLCGQPLTLNVSGTTFCCRAELFDNLQCTPSTVGGDGNEHPLVLFSVIVALAPLASSDSTQCSNSNTDKYANTNSAFRTIERIHRNLARLCNVLTREERRCQYVTLQCQMLLTVRKEYEDRLLLSTQGSSSCDTNQNRSIKNDESTPNTARRVNNSPGPNVSGTQTVTNDKRTVMQTPSSSSNVSKTSTYPSRNNEGEKKMSTDERREYIQQLIELMFASSPPDSNHGNLALELAEVFHFLSQHDEPTSPLTASTILSRASGRDIYINRHVAVPFDSLPIQMSVSETDGEIKSCHTLLFPSLSASEVLHSLSDDNLNLSFLVGGGASAIRRVLLQLHPSKTLKEVASDSALTTSQVLVTAEWLVGAGICVPATPVTRKSRFTCVAGVVNKMKQLSISFWQTFSSKSQHCQFHFHSSGQATVITGAPHIFLVVGALTSNAAISTEEKHTKHAASAPNLGDVIDSLCGKKFEAESGVQHQWSVQNAREKVTTMNNFLFERPRSLGSVGSMTQREEVSSEDAIIYSMAVWLVANDVICSANNAHAQD